MTHRPPRVRALSAPAHVATRDGVLYWPLIFFIAYLAFTLLLTVAGPVVYLHFDMVRVGLYLSAITAAVIAGYVIAVRGRMITPTATTPAIDPNWERLFFNVLLGISGLGFLFTLITFIGQGANFSLSGAGEAYFDLYERERGAAAQGYSLSFILYSALAPFIFMLNVLGLYYFKKLGLTQKILVAMVVFGSPILFMLNAGQQKTIGDLIVYMGCIFVIMASRSRKPISLRTYALLFAVAIAAVYIFSFILANRYTAIGIGAHNINYREIDLIYYDTTHPVFRIFGPDRGFAISAVVMYLTNGWNGLSYALHAEPTWSYLYGSSYSISVIAERYLGLESVLDLTYPSITAYESGWGTTRWYSVFAWFASDFTWIGTIPLFGWLAYVYGRCWAEIVEFRNPFSMLLFSLLTLGVVMMPANNQLMQTPGGLATLGLTVVMYLAYRRRYNRVQIPV